MMIELATAKFDNIKMSTFADDFCAAGKFKFLL